MRSSSQKDMFSENSDSDARKKVPQRISSSYDPKRKVYDIKFGYIVLFNFDVDMPAPFNFYKLSMFSETDLDKEWIEKTLGINSRVKPLTNLSPFPGQNFALFLKIEMGKL